MDTTIGIVGAGSVGAALAKTLTRAGYRVRIGVRPGKDVDAAASGRRPAPWPRRSRRPR